MARKKLLIALGSVCLILVLAAIPFMAACAPTPAGPIVFKVIGSLPKVAPVVHFIPTWVERVNERSNGELVLEYVGGPEIIPGRDQHDALMGNVIQMGLLASIHYQSLMPETNTVLVSELTPREERESGFHEYIAKLHKEKLNTYYLGRGATNSPFYMFLNTKIERPQDLNGKILTGFAVVDPIYEGLGISSAYIAPAEIYSAVERGVAEGFTMPLADSVMMKLTEVVKYMVDCPIYPANNVLTLVNLDAWNSLPEHLQKLLLDIQIEMEPEIEAYYDEGLEKSRQAAQDGGLEFIELSPTDYQWLWDLSRDSMWKQMEEKGAVITPELKAMLSK